MLSTQCYGKAPVFTLLCSDFDRRIGTLHALWMLIAIISIRIQDQRANWHCYHSDTKDAHG